MSQKQKTDVTPDLSIVIVSWSVRELLKSCLRSLRNSIDGLTFEVCVVDNASSDGSADMVRKESPDVRLIANSDNVKAPPGIRSNSRRRHADTGDAGSAGRISREEGVDGCENTLENTLHSCRRRSRWQGHGG
jgi:hypothetical protein